MDLHLAGKTAIVTGASQGFGRAITRELAMEGVEVLATARSEDLLHSLREEITSAGGIAPTPFVQDFMEASAPLHIANAALAAFGAVDILINNTGRSRAVDVVGAEEEWEAGMLLDFHRHRQLTQQLLPQFIERNTGSILNITSSYELRSINVSAVAKASLTQWSKQLAGTLGPHRITVNCLQPGLIDTANTQRLFSPSERQTFAVREIPLGDFGTPEDMASMAVFLVSPRARYVSGSVFTVDGGLRRHAF
ncbi:SDR family NAD(P)-dependent oxidoreductase [Olivibacter domesticus]|uniref:3-oxoacyl-[acyl-carrier protein] reductase n=1 Tax=Olivibacter domesticus TaxID=407022 RepID=A0A1H7REY1_OLID1|nr:SDR family oxidoreductase [Olivibacter domesticus]SEL57957.1 3-oxoacyl-[acyl-carrier protein] reductase [Olivibacter domesticus]